MMFFFENHSEPEPLLRDVFDGMNPAGGSLFDTMCVTSPEPPWVSYLDENGFLYRDLDFEYFGNHSGAKYCSPLVKHYIGSDGKLSSGGIFVMVRTLQLKYQIQWTRLWETMIVQYNPIHNYDMSETRQLTGSGTEKHEVDKTLGKTGTETLAHGLVNTTTHGKQVDEVGYKYGLNSNTRKANPSDEYVSEEGGSTVDSKTGNDVTTYNLSDTEDSELNKTLSNTERETLTRAGNIGVTTNQKMITDERLLWVWSFFDQVFSDVDKELALAVYDPCQV